MNNSIEYYGHRHHHLELIVVLGFIFVLGFIILSAFGGLNLISMTGNMIHSFSNEEPKIPITTDLTIPHFELDGVFKKLEIVSGSSVLVVGDQKIILDKPQNILILEDYEGAILLNPKQELVLDGDVKSVSINSVPIQSKSEKYMKIYSEENLTYNSLKLDEISVKKFFYKTSGRIDLKDKKSIFNINNETVAINNFEGSLEVKNKKMILKGYISGIEIDGETKISASA